jgi:murein DD-endopeptidase MepM/ murein hydrolase activator NlpD
VRTVALALGIAVAVVARPALADPFTYDPPGQLVPGSGEGRPDDIVYAPGIRFPIEDGPAFANSQVWGHGGSNGPGGSQCDAENYAYPWHDNYCETRSWDMPLCPAGIGHQGQDIRPATCENLTHWAVAVVDGTITNIGSYSIYLTAADGTRFDYLHTGNVQVQVGQEVKRGDHLSQVSNEFGGTPTTIHLHFNIRQYVDGFGSVYVPPYMSIIQAYSALLDVPVLGSLDFVGCDGVRGWAFDGDTPDEGLDVTLSSGDGEGVVRADQPRDDLCETLGSCDHAFDVLAPLSLFDAAAHDLHATGPGPTELAESPSTLTCEPVELDGSRRLVGDAAFAGWAFDSFFDEAPVDAGELAALPEGAALADVPELLVDGGGQLWLVDGGNRRSVSAAAALAWRFDPSSATPDDGSLAAGEPLGERPVLGRAGDGSLYLVDARIGHGQPGGPEDPTADDDALDAQDSGCACHAVAADRRNTAGWLGVALALVSIVRGRRRKTPKIRG